jgi:hypothetical protein
MEPDKGNSGLVTFAQIMYLIGIVALIVAYAVIKV